jgi:DNA-binding MarR family transcriptional regulator
MSENSARGRHGDSLVATRINWLGNRLVTTASATYGQIGLGFLHARLLYLLQRRPDITAARISDIIGVDAAAVSRAVKALRARKLIRQAAGPVRSLSLTDEGRRLSGLIETIADEREQRLLRGFSAGETEQLLSLLNRMLDNMDDVAHLAVAAPKVAAPKARAG